MNYLKDINGSVNLSPLDAERILKIFFLNTNVELTFISKDINIKQTVNFSEIINKGNFIYMFSLELSEFHINTLEFDSVYYYSLGSIVFIFKNGSTLTIRSLKNLSKLKNILVKK
ncbi:hypothetical protein [Ilyobacter sp.]|uniref:hypothetical protein n=1 Tax=Ilyobacter sp. TaxID=3100343 RepID=UPI003564E3DA